MMPVQKNTGHYRQATTVFVNPILIMGFVTNLFLFLADDKGQTNLK
jgi:hypothetical protein